MLKSYNGYRETNISWLEEVPNHWECKRINTIFSENKEINSKLDNIDAFQFKFGELVAKKKYEINEELAKTYSKYTLIQPQDIMINGLNLNYDYLTQRVALVKENGIVTSAYISLRPRANTNSKYYTFLLKSLDSRKIFNGMGSGIRLTLDFSELKKINVPTPPREEQDQIVKYLDWQTSKINTLIESKKRQIKLLKEQKQAVINKVVTKGIVDNVPMKDSGIDWLGEVPEHWVVKPLKYFVSSNDESLSNSEDDNLEINYIDISSVGFTYLKTKPIKYKFKDAPSRARRIVRTGDTIISTVRTYLKSMCYIDEKLDKCIVSTGFSVLRANNNVFAELLTYSLSCDYFVNQISKTSIGVSYPAISDNKLLDIKIVLPKTQNEQIRIYEFAQEKTTLIDKAINVIEKEIELVSEYKTSLISSVVTGKVDVRGVVVPDFEVVE